VPGAQDVSRLKPLPCCCPRRFPSDLTCRGGENGGGGGLCRINVVVVVAGDRFGGWIGHQKHEK
jgi:hypothetical protein